MQLDQQAPFFTPKYISFDWTESVVSAVLNARCELVECGGWSYMYARPKRAYKHAKITDVKEKPTAYKQPGTPKFLGVTEAT